MREYREFQPTGFDPKGLALDDQQDWLVAPVSRTRDTGPLEESNFECALSELGGESDTVEVHRFGHWGPGWFEIIIIDPKDEKRVKIAEDIERALMDYPVLDDMDFSQREYEEFEESWDNWGRSEFIDVLVNHHELSDNARDLLEDQDDLVYELFRDTAIDWMYQTDGSGVTINTESAKDVSRTAMAELLRLMRRK